MGREEIALNLLADRTCKNCGNSNLSPPNDHELETKEYCLYSKNGRLKSRRLNKDNTCKDWIERFN